MNGKEIARHTTALDDLAAAMEEFVEATESRIVNFEKETRTDLSELRQRELRHFDEARNRMDRDANLLRAADEDLHKHLADAWKLIREHETRLDLILASVKITFWERLRWLVTGK